MKQTLRSLMFKIETRESSIVLFLSFVILLCGIIYSYHLGDNLRFYDEIEYYSIAKNLAYKQIFSVDGTTPTASRPPVYPFILSLVISLGGTVKHLRIVNFLTLAVSLYFIFLIVKNMSSPFAGMISAILVVCYPVLFYAASILLTEIIGILLFVLIIYLLIKAKPDSLKPFILIGLVFGILILTVPYFIFSLLVFSIWLTLSRYKGGIKPAITVFIIAISMVSVWTARNYTVFNSFVFISTHGARAFYHGNFKGATANPVSKTDYLIPQEQYDKLNEIELAKYFKSKAIEHILENKTRATKLYLLKVMNYFNFYNKLSSNEESYVSKYKDIIMFLTYVPLLCLFIIRIVSFKNFKFSQLELLFVSLYFSNAFFLALFLTRIRYRISFDVLLIVVVSIFINNYILKQKKNSQS